MVFISQKTIMFKVNNPPGSFSGGIDPLLLNNDTRWKRVVNFTFWSLYLRGRSLRLGYPFYMYMYVYIGFKTFLYVVRHLDYIASYLPTGLHLGFCRSWPSSFLPSSFSSVFLALSFVSASTSMLFWVVFLLPFFEHGHTMWAGSVQSLL